MFGKEPNWMVPIFWLITLFVAFGLQAQQEIYSNGFEPGEACLWSKWVTPELCDGLDNDCDSAVDEGATCDDGLDCTQDSCLPLGCDFLIDSGTCVIAGQCFGSGVMNPLNSCETCDPATSQTGWTSIADGTACGDLECNECASGVCVDSVIGLPGPDCSDNTASECDSPDTCAAGGICQSNYALFGTACGGALIEPICNPDICNGSGNCIDHAPASDGTTCGGLVCEECLVGVCVGVATCGDGTVCAGVELCDDGNADVCGSCNATCSGPGSGLCPQGTGCLVGADCVSGTCTEALCE